MPKFLVTGGCGFIGSAVVNYLLERGDEVHVVDNLSVGRNHWQGQTPKPNLIIEDIRSHDTCERILQEVRPHTVLHLAAHHFIPLCEKDPYAAYDLNVLGTLNVLEAARHSGVSDFFLASTGDVYHPNFIPHREIDPAGPVYVYGHTKLLAEQICIRYFESLGCFRSVCIGRLFNAAGPRETNPHLLAEVTRQIAIEGRNRVEVGNLWPLRDYVDVDSMAGCIVDATANLIGLEIVNIGSGRAVEVRKALETLSSVLQAPIDIVSVPERQRANDRPFLCPDISRLRRLIGRAAEPFSGETARRIFSEFPAVPLN